MDLVLFDQAGFFFLCLKYHSLENYLKRRFLVDIPRHSAREVIFVSNPKNEEEYILRISYGFLGMRGEDKYKLNDVFLRITTA